MNETIYDEAVNTLVRQIIQTSAAKNPGRPGWDQTVPGVVLAPPVKKRYPVDIQGHTYKLFCCHDTQTFSPGDKVWVLKPLGSLANMHISGRRY